MRPPQAKQTLAAAVRATALGSITWAMNTRGETLCYNRDRQRPVRPVSSRSRATSRKERVPATPSLPRKQESRAASGAFGPGARLRGHDEYAGILYLTYAARCWFKSHGSPPEDRAHCETVPARRKKCPCCARQSAAPAWRSARASRYKWSPRPDRRSCARVPGAPLLSKNRDHAGEGHQAVPPGRVPPPR